jgi:hypothetical protein
MAATTGRLVIPCLVILVLAISCTGGASDDFDSARWRQGTPDWSGARYRMMDSLVDDIGIVGKSRSEAANLLGQPDFGDDAKWTYRVGPHGSQFRYLTIDFENDTVIDYHLTVWE